MDDCPRFCANCPLIPDEVGEAKLTKVEPVTADDLRRYARTARKPNAGKYYLNTARISAKVTASISSSVRIGDTTSMLVRTGDKSFAELRKAVTNCNGPVLTRFQRIFWFLGPRGRCGAIDSREAYPGEN